LTAVPLKEREVGVPLEARRELPPLIYRNEFHELFPGSA
jgi:hypothetical protein